MVKIRERKFNVKIFLILLVLSLFLVNGQQGCPQASGPAGTGTTGVGGGKAPSTASQKTGLDFSFVQGLDYLYSGKKIQPGETFLVNILLENSGESSKSGEICINDNLEDIYGGISKSCKPFSIEGAIYDGQGKLVSPKSKNIGFDESYKYSGLPTLWTVNADVTLTYDEQVVASTAVSVPEPPAEKPSVTIAPSPLSVSVEKSVIPVDQGYKLSLRMTFQNNNREATITAPNSGYKKEGLTFNPRFSQSSLECDFTDPLTNYVQLDALNTKFIRCSTLLPREQITYPFLMDLIYGVKIEKKLTFTVEKEEKKSV